MRTLVALGLFLLLAWPLRAQDVAGSKDHPLLTRYPGTTIQWYQFENHRPFRLPLSSVTGYRNIGQWLDTEGRVTRLYYEYGGTDRSFSEIYQNYEKAVVDAGMEVLASGFMPAGARGNGIGSREWRHEMIRQNPTSDNGPVRLMVAGSATSGGSGSIIAKKERPEGTVFAAVSVYQYSADKVGILVDVIEAAVAETGLIAVDVDAITKGIAAAGKVVLDGLFFDFDKATLQPSSKPALDNIAAYLKAHPQGKFYVVGHTDGVGTFAYNMKLSSDRAAAVADALVKGYGIASERLVPQGVGPLSPVFSNATDGGRERNRRVELVALQ